MKWSIAQLLKLQTKGLEIDEAISIDDLTETKSDIRGISPVKVKGRADISSTKATFFMTIEGTLVLPCSRTLVDVDFPFHVETTETYLFKEPSYDVSDEDNIHMVTGETVDLLPIIKENILLQIPIQVFSEESDPEGAAPQSGNDWEVISEQDKKKKVDPRLAGLANFFDED
ncbi:DUF177 domain-containing protein [Bacillus sp. HMF5848]|uniref:YceD family protein n=1 Tax=Bacillus sp. HMF5848 TaxID=2495421 RepID=UPI000F785ED7|nr:DUF177 domain-containing protein [Bacillus sp. HMF5848]RSK26924.1 DUF177 domain-containing protein [Bacillus sp. HMF5848]